VVVPVNPLQLIAAGIHPTQAKAFSDPLSAVCALYDIDSPSRQAAFFAQFAVETWWFTQLEENLYYTDADRLCSLFPSTIHDHETAARLCRNPEALANVVYASKNGNTQPGDGWLYRGRGPGLTGRWNYAKAAEALSEPYLDQPDLVAQPKDACAVAGWFWQMRECNPLADAGDIDAITRAWNGSGMAGLADRRQAYGRALVAFTTH
jgi:putative chitinase